MARRGPSGDESAPVARFVAVVLIAVAAAAAAELAVHLLEPAEVGPSPLPVTADRWFDSDATAAAKAYRDGQHILYLIGFGVELAALTLLALGRPPAARRLLDRLAPRPVLGAAVAAAGISLLLALLALPTGLIAHERSVDVGLSTQGLGGWLADRGKGAAIAALLAAAGGMILIGLQRRLPRLWWLAGTGVVIAYAFVSTWLAPVVLAPVFNDFEELPPGPARRAVLDLAERSGVEVGHVYVVDASRRSSGVNAYVDGIGSSRRVVLYDNLVDRADGPVLRAVVAHELGHVAHSDLPRGLLFVAMVAPLGMLLVAVAGTALAGRGGSRAGLPSAIPAYALLIAVVAFGLNLAGNQLSRSVEASADRFALGLTGDPRGFVELQQRLVADNRSDPDPSGTLDDLLRTHPTAVQRIGAALAYAEQRGIALGEPAFAPAR
ncbi:MAG: M48 family metalloprotease [Solirubrobacterales bacterium]|nr:M48 family metalloprotease [Solirubrobacterales bacterium]